MDGCLGTETLVDFLEGVADATSRARVEEHASRCEPCREILSSLARNATPSLHPAGRPCVDRVVAPGSRLGRYVIVHEIGAGGMGMVYAARDPELDRVVALKLLRGESNPALQERLR